MERIFLWHLISWMQYKNILLLAGFARLPFGSSANGLVFDDFFSTPRPKLHFMERRRDDSHGKKPIFLFWRSWRLPSKFPDLWSDLSSMRSHLCLPRLSTKVRTPAAAPSCSPARLCTVSSHTSPQCSAGYIEPRYISCSRAKPPGEASLTARCLIRQGNQGAELQAHAGLTHHLPTATSHNPAALTSPARTPWFHYCMSPSASDAHCIFVSFWL